MTKSCYLNFDEVLHSDEFEVTRVVRIHMQSEATRGSSASPSIKLGNVYEYDPEIDKATVQEGGDEPLDAEDPGRVP